MCIISVLNGLERFLAHHGCGITALIPDLRNMKGTDLPSNLPSALSAPKQTFPLLTRFRGDRSQQPHGWRALFSRINLILEMRTRVSESLVSLSCQRATESGRKPRSMATEPSCFPCSKQPPSSCSQTESLAFSALLSFKVTPEPTSYQSSSVRLKLFP